MTKPAWQTDGGCAMRTENDVSAVADPSTGVWVYDTYPSGTWDIVGGTSASTPIVGAMYALAGNAMGSAQMNSLPYRDPGALNDVTSGSDAAAGCAPAYLCTGEIGYDGPTGLGTPNGIGAFSTRSAPTVSGVRPSSGPVAGGQSVTVTGTNLTGATDVDFGVMAASDVVVGAGGTTLSVTTPAGASGTVDVTVATPAGQSAISSSDTYTYLALPSVTGIAPDAGPLAGGTMVTISGSGLAGATGVSFGPISARSFSVVSDSEITAIAPVQGEGIQGISVTTPEGTSGAESVAQFTYERAPTITAVSPASGPMAGGTSVIVLGTGFTGATGVAVRALAVTSFTVVSPTEITAVAPAQGAGVDNIFVTTLAGTSVAVPADHYTYVNPPAKAVITGITPASGPTAGGSTVTITGTGFTGATGPTGVVFRALNATSYAVDSDTQITATAPAQSAGVDNVFVTTPSGTSSAVTADHYTYVIPPPPPTITSLSPTSGPSTGSTTVTVTGTGFTASSTVAFRALAANSVTYVSSTELTCAAPAQAVGVDNVFVTTPGAGTSAAVSADHFTYTS
jgi:hypothetical protein